MRTRSVIFLLLLASSAIEVTSSGGYKTSFRALKKREEKKDKKKVKKGGKGGSVDGATLVAKLEMYPGSAGDFVPDGKVTVRFNMDGSFHMKMDAEGLEPDCISCGVHIHTGTTCDDASLVGGHYWDTVLFGELASEDPWNRWAFYKTDSTGKSTTGFAGDSGFGYDLNVGRAVVLHAADGTRIGCGLLKPSVSVATKKLEADMGAYPGYAGALTPSGETMVEFYNDDTFKFTLDLEGLEANCLECGVHIHSGTTCANASLVGGHYWNVNIFGANTTDDPWSATNGAFYNTHSKGEAKRYFFLDQGYGWKDTVGHAVVIHGINGTRISCGILS